MTDAGTRGAVFLDRDGTIIDDAHYIAKPELVRLRPGAADAIAALNRAAIPVIVVTNQSGMARGLISDRDYRRVEARLAELLASEGARIDSTYVCPHHPEFDRACDCRKPGTLLFRRAAEDHHLDLTRSSYIGDRWRDVQPGIVLGGRPILIMDESTEPAERTRAEEAGVEMVGSLREAVARLLDGAGKDRGGP